MTERFPLEAIERTALRVDPPRDSSGRLLPWTLDDRFVKDEEWEDHAFAQEGLTLLRVTFERVGWKAAGVFRDCVFREVTFADCTLSGFRFEDVTFEGCLIAGLAIERCSFTRCHFIGGQMGSLSAVRSQFRRCTWSAVEAPDWSLDDCALEGCFFEDTHFTGLRASRSITTCQLFGGALLSADITECRGELLEIRQTETRGVRALGLELGKLSLCGLRAGQLSLGQSTLGELSLGECGEFTTLSLVACTVGTLTVESCASLEGVNIRASRLSAVSVRRSTLGNTTFDGVDAPGDSRIAGSTLRGLFFKEGAWARLELSDVQLADYLAVENTRFDALTKHDVREPEEVRRRLDGEQYGVGSSTWRTSDGS